MRSRNSGIRTSRLAIRQRCQLFGVQVLRAGGGAVSAGVASEVAQQGHRPRGDNGFGDRPACSAGQLGLSERQELGSRRRLAEGALRYRVLVPAGQLACGDDVGGHPDVGAMTKHRDGPAPPFVGHRAAEREQLTHHPARRAQSAQLHVERHRGQWTGQRLGEALRAEDREPRIDPVVEFALQPVGCRATQPVGRPESWQRFDRQLELSALADRPRGVESAADKSARGVGDRVQRAPAEFKLPILLQRSEIQIGNQLRPRLYPVCARTRVGGSQQPPRGDHVGGVRGGQVNDAVAVGADGQQQEANQVVEVQHPHRLRRRFGAQQRGHSTAHHPVELAADRRRNPNYQARPPTSGHQRLGGLPHVGPPRGLGHVQQSGTGAGRRMGHLGDAVDAGMGRRCRVDRCEMDDRVGLVGQILQDGIG